MHIEFGIDHRIAGAGRCGVDARGEPVPQAPVHPVHRAQRPYDVCCVLLEGLVTYCASEPGYILPAAGPSTTPFTHVPIVDGEVIAVPGIRARISR